MSNSSLEIGFSNYQLKQHSAYATFINWDTSTGNSLFMFNFEHETERIAAVFFFRIHPKINKNQIKVLIQAILHEFKLSEFFVKITITTHLFFIRLETFYSKLKNRQEKFNKVVDVLHFVGGGVIRTE